MRTVAKPYLVGRVAGGEDNEGHPQQQQQPQEQQSALQGMSHDSISGNTSWVQEKQLRHWVG